MKGRKKQSLNLIFCYGNVFIQDNPHRLTLSMSPDESYYEKQAKLEAEKLKQKVNALSEEEKKQTYEKG